jgi:hypothetical protein
MDHNQVKGDTRFIKLKEIATLSVDDDWVIHTRKNRFTTQITKFRKPTNQVELDQLLDILERIIQK